MQSAKVLPNIIDLIQSLTVTLLDLRQRDALTWCFCHCSLKSSVAIGLVTHQFSEFVSAFQQLFQARHQFCIRIEVNPVGYLSYLYVKERTKGDWGTTHDV